MLKNIALASTLILLSINTALAALSWNFKSDIRAELSPTQKGVWGFMQNIPGNTKPAKYTLLPTYQSNCDLTRWHVPRDPNFSCWQDIKSEAVIGTPTKGTFYLYMIPGKDNQLILRWQSPIAGNVSMTGRVTDTDDGLINCNKGGHDGIKWFLRTETAILKQGVIANGKGASFAIPRLPVKKAARLYVVIDKGKNNWCDSTDVDWSIKQLTTVTPPAPTVFGAAGGIAFTDKVASTQTLTGIALRTQWWITSIQGLTNGRALPVHGTSSSGARTVVKWPANEYLVRAYGTYGDYLGKISFVTNTGKVLGPYGDADAKTSPKKFDLKVPAGNQIVGFKGRANTKILYAIGLIYRKAALPPAVVAPDLAVTLAQPFPPLTATALSEITVTIKNLGTSTAKAPLTLTMPMTTGIETPIKFARNVDAWVCITNNATKKLTCTSSKTIAGHGKETFKLAVAPTNSMAGKKIGAFKVTVSTVAGEKNITNNTALLIPAGTVKKLSLPGIKDDTYSKLLLNPAMIRKAAFSLPLTNLLAPHYQFKPDTKTYSGSDFYKLNIDRIKTHILPPGFPATTVDAYGDCDCMETFSYPAHTIIANSTLDKRGKQTLIQFNDNRDVTTHLLPLDASIHGADRAEPQIRSVVHLHGFKQVDEKSDGYPEAWKSPLGKKGEDFVNSESGHSVPHNPDPFVQQNKQAASLLWFHDHTLGITRLNVYAGLAGLYVLRDNNEQAMIDNGSLPSGAYEIPLALQDRMFHTDGSLAYPDRNPEIKSAPKLSMLPEFFGKVIVVNGIAWPYLEVEPRKYRFRLLNGSNARFYSLTLSNSAGFYVLGTEGGFLPAPVPTKSLTIGPGERYDFVIDFSAAAHNQTIILKNSANSPYPDGDDKVTAGLDDQIIQFRVTQPLSSVPRKSLPTRLRLPDTTVLKPVKTHQVLLAETVDPHGRVLPILGTVKEGIKHWMAPPTEVPKAFTTETWEIYNHTVDAHPVHLHGGHFKIIDRRTFSADDNDLKGLTHIKLSTVLEPKIPYEQTWKDTVIAWPGQMTRINVKFENAGLFVWHCHILEHEDHDMMRPLSVQ
ncbi:multicopper oxidase domain-containing protein [Crenothrix polyspora]|uniref:Jacalin-type lectin domain-containing protein n=1 Tax=Crenothrix polyspora TaxID=360316 RepID=A0A1R4H633_9GAMM|nr:multicopper oxidase domain-containing protein [Crenothrix polyspora]SJM91713.1 conserved exported hypothetical protein [Crenothrix polyspora]